MRMVRATIILPIYNERKNLVQNFPGIYAEAKRLGSTEIIISEDGSDDGTAEISRRFARLPGVRVLHRAQKSGRGAALKRSIRVARGRVIGYMDIDLSVPLQYMEKAIEKVEEGNKIVIGSRYAKGARIKRDALRHLLSSSYNWLLFLSFGSRVKDHQCGFKFFDGKYAKAAIGKIKDDHWFFDSEMLILAQRGGIVPYELPVEWKEHRETKVRPRDILLFLKSIVRLRFSGRQDS